MSPYAPTSGPSYAEGIGTEEHQVLEAQPQIATERPNQAELRLVAQNSPMPDLFAKVRRWAIRLSDDVDLEPWSISSLQISNVAMPETIITAWLSKAHRLSIWSIDDLRLQISNAVMPETIITALRRCGLDGVADRLSYLHQLVEDDQDEPSINLDSLRKLALFLLSEQQLGNPQIGVDPNGLAQAEWPVGEKGVLAMVFLPSGFIRFAAIAAPARRGVECKRASGTLSKSETLDAVRPFTDCLASQ